MIIITLTNGMIFDGEVETTRRDILEMLDDGMFNETPIDKIIELSSGLLGRDITAEVALLSWELLDADDRRPHHELQVWLESHGHNCDHLGADDGDCMIMWPRHRD